MQNMRLPHPHRIAEALGLNGGTEAIKQALPKTLGQRRTLVVVDGLGETDAKSAIAVLLGAGPKVSVIVTSTPRVGLASEQIITLQPFSTSAAKSTPSPAAAFVKSMLDLLGPVRDVDAARLDAAVKPTSGLPSELEQVALDFLTRLSA
jgi:hypothetical protein